MAAGREGVLVFNPAVAAVNGAKPNVPPGGRGPANDQSGGGLVSGAGTFYSKATVMASQGWNNASEIFTTTGDLAGTMSAEFSNATDEEILKVTDAWVADTAVIADQAVAAAGDYKLKALMPIPYGRMRTKFARSGGTGTIKSRRVIKAS